MKEITTYGKKRRRIGKIIGALAGIAVLAALVVFGLFRVRHMKISGNSIYSSTDIQNAVMQDGLCKNTLYLMWKYKDDSRVEEELPFLSSVEVEMLSPSEVEIRVYEKPEVGYFLNGTDYIYFDQNLLSEIADYFRPIRDEALESGLLNPKNMGVNIKTLLYQVPGGMLSNLTSQLKEQGAEDKYYDVLEEVPRVRKDLGEPPLVTPSSQIVGTQAVFNVLMGERYKMATKETKDILSGKYGETVKPFNEDVKKKVLGENPEVITCRPADLIPDELDTLRSECAQWMKQDEDVLSYALFPQVATDFFKYREAQETKVDHTIADTKNGSYPV